MCVFGALAQLVVRYIRIVEVTGSTPVCSTFVKYILSGFIGLYVDEAVCFVFPIAMNLFSKMN